MNQVILLGNVVDAPKRTKAGGIRVHVETVLRWIDEVTGQRQQESQVHRVDLWGKAGARAEKALAPGHSVYVEGRARPRHWVDNTGRHHYEVNVSSHRWLEVGPPEARWT